MKAMRILVNIDCLFDTMLACVMDINEGWAVPLAKGGYISRKHNTLSRFHSEIDDEAVRQRWLTRDITILRKSRRTNLVNLLRDYITQSNLGDKDHPQAYDYQLILNTFPYELSKGELKELFVCLKMVLGADNLSRVHIPVTELTPEYIKANYNRFILYDFDEWVQLHGDNLTQCRMPTVTCVIPMCYRPGMEDMQEEDEVVRWVSYGYKPILDVEFIRLADMSIHIPPGYDFGEE